MTLGPTRSTMLRWSMPMFDEDGDKGGGKNGEPTGNKGASGENNGDKGFTPITSQDQLDTIITNRLDRARRSMAADLKKEIREELEEEIKTKAAKENEDYKALYEAEQKKVQKLEAEKAEADLNELRQKVLKDAGLPETSLDFLVGKNEAELKASAKKLAELVKPKEVGDTDLGKTSRAGDSNKREKKEDYEDPDFWNS